MEKVSKSKVILRAFSGQSNLDEETINYRRSKCEGCPFNSKNSEEKSILETMREKLGKPFCTLCGCNIEEKTTQATEYCAKRDKGMHPEWNAVILETKSNRDINVMNHSADLVNLDLDSNGVVIVDFGLVSRKSYKHSQFSETFTLSISCEDFPIKEIRNISTGCGCTNPTPNSLGDGVYEIEVGLKFDLAGSKKFKKTMTVNFAQALSNNSATPRTLYFHIIGKIID